MYGECDGGCKAVDILELHAAERRRNSTLRQAIRPSLCLLMSLAGFLLRFAFSFFFLFFSFCVPSPRAFSLLVYLLRI